MKRLREGETESGGISPILAAAHHREIPLRLLAALAVYSLQDRNSQKFLTAGDAGMRQGDCIP